MSDINRLCNVMREMHYKYNMELNNRLDSDRQNYLRSRIGLLEILLQEAAFIKKDANLAEVEIVEDVGC